MSLFDLTPAGIAPVAGEGCATGLSTAQYTGTIAWKTANGAHSGNFAVSTAYTAEITLTVKSGYTFDGVGANAFTYSGVAGVTNPAGQGSGLAVTIIFPATSDSVPVKVTALALNGHVTAPVRGAAPNTAAIATDQYTGTIAWKTANGAHSGNFAAETVYIAEVSLSVKSGYTFTGVAEDSFTYSGAAGVTNPAGQGSGLTVTITFPKTSG
ncbi:MAG: hypothetical protein LBD37_02970, partial [Treponema sp.]|nr:hypothetical protein [Treponema sp.]